MSDGNYLGELYSFPTMYTAVRCQGHDYVYPVEGKVHDNLNYQQEAFSFMWIDIFETYTLWNQTHFPPET